MKKFILFSFLLIFSVWAGLQIETDPGYVLFAYHDWSVEMPLWFFIIICLLVGAFFYAFFAIINNIKKWFQCGKKFITYFQSRKQRKRAKEFAEYERQIKLLKEASEQSDLNILEKQWKQFSCKYRKNPQFIVIYAQGLLQHKQLIHAEAVLRKALNKHWDKNLINLYGQAIAEEAAKQLKRLEQWLKLHGESAELMLALGRIANANRLWGKARYYLERSIELQSTSQAHYEYGMLLEQLGESREATEAFRQGLI